MLANKYITPEGFVTEYFNPDVGIKIDTDGIGDGEFMVRGQKVMYV